MCWPVIYRYWHGRGLSSIVVSGLLNIAALAFTIAFSGFLLLFVNWGALHSECIVQDTCDIISVALYSQPLRNRSIGVDVLILTYLSIFGLYWLWTAAHFVCELRDMAEVRRGADGCMHTSCNHVHAHLVLICTL